MRIDPIGEQPLRLSVESTAAERPAGDPSFSSVLGDMVSRVDDANRASLEKSAALASGATDDLHGTMIAAKEAEINLKLLGSVRNKLLDAFHEIWRTSV